MDPDASRLAGLFLVVGSVLFGVGAANPALMRAWTAPPEVFLATVAAHATGWRVTNLLMIAAAVVTPAGLVAMTAAFAPGWQGILAVAGAVAFAVGSVLWLVALLHRLTSAVDEARRWAAHPDEPPPAPSAVDRLAGSLFAAFIVIGAAGLAAVGIGGAAAGVVPALVGWGAAALSAVLVAGLVVTGDMPPFTLYVAPLVFGIVLLVGA